jgi:hypothetical protein
MNGPESAKSRNVAEELDKYETAVKSSRVRSVTVIKG